MRRYLSFFVWVVVISGLLTGLTTAAAQVAAPENGFVSESRAGRGVPDLSEGADLQQYIHYALEKSAALRAAHDRWLAALEQIPQARSLPDPMFSYSYYVQEVETRVGPQRQRFMLSQTFPWFGKLRLKEAMSTRQAEAVWLSLNVQALQLQYEVSKVFYDCAYLKHATDITRGNFDLLKSFEAVARERYRTGGPMTGVVQAQVELGKLDDRLSSLLDMRQPLSAKLNALLNREPTTPLSWPELPDGKLPELNRHALIGHLREQNPDLQRLAAMARKEAAAADLAGRQKFPDLTFGISYIDTGSALMDNTDDDGKDPVLLTVSFNLPVWRGKYRAARQQALHRSSAWEAEFEDHRRQLEADVEWGLYHYREAARRIHLYRDTLLPKARQSLTVARQAFEAGTVDFVTLIDAQRVLLNFQLEAVKARSEQGKRLAELRMLCGFDPADELSGLDRTEETKTGDSE